MTSPDVFIETHGRGPVPVVLIHGWAMHGGVFAPLIAALENRCTLHVVDLPGHGYARASTLALEPAACARAIAAATPPAIWLGWSLGGLIALTGALDHADRVRGLAMIAASPRFVRGGDWPYAVEPALFRQFSADLKTDYRGTLERFLALEALGSDQARDELRRLRADVFTHGEPNTRVLCEGLDLLDHADLRARLPELTQSSVWIAGRRDRLIPWPAMQWSAAQCGGAFTRIEHSGHAPFIGHVDEVVTALQPLLAGVAA